MQDHDLATPTPFTQNKTPPIHDTTCVPATGGRLKDLLTHVYGQRFARITLENVTMCRFTRVKPATSPKDTTVTLTIKV